MITIIDKDGNKEAREDSSIVEQIEAIYNGCKASNIVIEKENGAISATIEKWGKYIGVGWLNADGKVEELV